MQTFSNIKTNLWRTAVVGMVILSHGSARADDFDRAVKALLQASYDNLETATECVTVIGPSRYWQARVAVENALRAAGYSAATALSQTDAMVRRTKQQVALRPSPGIPECLANYTRTSKALLRQRDRIDSGRH